MALTITKIANLSLGNAEGVVVDVDFDSSYPTGGESLTASDLGFQHASDIKLVLASPDGGYIFQYDYTNKKLLAYYADYDAVADGALIQVPNTTDLSGVTDVRLLALAAVNV